MVTKSLKTNAILNIIYTVVNILFPLITFPYVSRILLVENIGKYNFFNTLANYAIVFGSLGISTYGIRAVARAKSNERELNKTVQELLYINIVASIVVVLFLGVSSIFIDKFKDNLILFIIYLIYVLVSPMAVNWLYSGLEQYKYITIRSLIFKFIALICIFLFVNTKNDLLIYCLIMIFANVGGYICNIIYSKKLVSYKKTKLELKKHLKPMFVLFASILAVYVYIHLDTLMLGFICNDYEVGLYTVSVYVKSALLNIINAISAVLLPRISYYVSKGNEDECNRLIKKSTTIIFALSIPLTVFFVQNAYDTIMLLGGREYIDAVSCMQVIMPILLISGFSNILGNQILIPRGKEKFYLIAVSCGAIIDLILNLLFMPSLGCLGAALATLIAEIVQMSIQFVSSKKYILKNINYISIAKIILATFAAFITTTLMASIINYNSFINLIINVAIYFGVYLFTVIITREEETLSLTKGFIYKLKNICK